MSQINNPPPLSSSSLLPGDIDVIIPAHFDEVFGSVTGLLGTPAYVVSSILYEESIVVQSGMTYEFNVLDLVTNGFNWRLRVLGNEFWPGPGSVTVKVNYIWSPA